MTEEERQGLVQSAVEEALIKGATIGKRVIVLGKTFGSQPSR
jgi:hypothetical protein